MHKRTKDFKTKCVYLHPRKGPHKFTMIFLHGLGDSPAGFIDVFTDFELCPPNFRVVLPHAPTAYVTYNKAKMPSWFDYYDLELEEASTLKEIRESFSQKDLMASVQKLNKIIEEEAQLLPG